MPIWASFIHTTYYWISTSTFTFYSIKYSVDNVMEPDAVAVHAWLYSHCNTLLQACTTEAQHACTNGLMDGIKVMAGTLLLPCMLMSCTLPHTVMHNAHLNQLFGSMCVPWVLARGAVQVANMLPRLSGHDCDNADCTQALTNFGHRCTESSHLAV